jgi:hypothetical protein
MGQVIGFPEHGRMARGNTDMRPEPATVIILPVIRIERYTDEPDEGITSRAQRRRRRRAAAARDKANA